MIQTPTYTAFAAARRVARGPLADVLASAKRERDADPECGLLFFEDATGREVDFDLRGSLHDILERVRPQTQPTRGPGRPKLGVESRQVTLLPRHWAWLERQPSGASAALRRLVEEASRREDPGESARTHRDAAYRVMAALAGDRPGFEEASRALFAGDRERFRELVAAWPGDIAEHLGSLLDASA
jgi:hypothetical protein